MSNSTPVSEKSCGSVGSACFFHVGEKRNLAPGIHTTLRLLRMERIQLQLMPRLDETRSPVTEADVLAHLSRSRRPQSLREIAAALDLRHSGRRALVKLARKMKKRGEIHEYPNGRVGLPKEKQGAEYARPPQQAQKGAPQRHGLQQR